LGSEKNKNKYLSSKNDIYIHQSGIITTNTTIIKVLCKREKIEGKGEEQILRLQKHFPGFFGMVQNHKDSQYSPVDTSLYRR
jgi:hypothetical protein